jgi:hypothetical protein
MPNFVLWIMRLEQRRGERVVTASGSTAVSVETARRAAKNVLCFPCGVENAEIARAAYHPFQAFTDIREALYFPKLLSAGESGEPLWAQLDEREIIYNI